MTPNQRVVFRSFGSIRHGRVIKLTKTTATVLFDDGHEKRLPINTLRPETAEDIARRDHEQATRAWLARRPETELARVTMSRMWERSQPHGAEVLRANTPAEMRAAADELLKLADWFEAKP